MADTHAALSSSEPAYRYEATIRLVVAANGLDEAHRIQREAASHVMASAAAVGGQIKSATGSIMDLQHRPDLEGGPRGR